MSAAKTCACPHADPNECVILRYPARDHAEAADAVRYDDPCDCRCHDWYDEEDEDYADPDPMGIYL